MIRRNFPFPIDGYALILFIIVFLFTWWSNPNFTAYYSPDTWEYIKVGKDFSNPANEIRPFLYPLFIKICRIICPESWENLVIFFQMVFHSLTIILLFRLFLIFQSTKMISFILSLLIGINPNLLVYSSKLLPQQLLGVLIALTFYFAVQLYNSWNNKDILKNVNVYVTGICSGLALVLKPSWMFGVIPIIITIYIFKKWNKKSVLAMIIILFFHSSFNLVWREYKDSLNLDKVYGIESNIFEETLFWVQGQNINLAAIRMGLIDSAEDTPLYNRIKEKELLADARELRGAVDKKYKKVIKSFTWEEMNDVEFAKAILKNAPTKLLFGQLKTWPTFFTKRMFHPNDGFPGLPKFIKYLYIGSFNKIYQPGLIFFLMAFLCLIYKRDLQYVVVLTGMILIYFSLLHAVFTPSPEHFIYYRTSVEYILFFAAFLPLGLLFEKLILYKK